MAELEFSPEELDAIRKEWAPGATDSQFTLFIAECKRRNLVPGRHIVFQSRRAKEWDPDTRSYVWVAKPIYITTISALLLVAQRTGEYEGQGRGKYLYIPEPDETTSQDFIESSVPLPDSNNPRLPRLPWVAEATVYRKGFREPMIGDARFEAYAAYQNVDNTRKLTQMWATRGCEQLLKCATAAALRSAFPEDTGNLYLMEEIRAEEEESPKPHGITPASVVPLPPPVPAVNQTPAVPTDTPRPNETPAVGPTKEEVQETLKQSLPLIKQFVENPGVEAKLAEEGKQINPELTKALAAVPGLKPASELPTPAKKRGGRPKAKSPDNGRNIAAEGGITDEDIADAGEPLPEFDEAANKKEAEEFVEAVSNMTETEAAAQGLPDPPEYSKLPEKAERDSFIARTRALPEPGADIKSIGDYMLLFANKVGQPSKNLTVEDWTKALEKLEAAKKDGTLKELLTEAKNVPMPAF